MEWARWGGVVETVAGVGTLGAGTGTDAGAGAGAGTLGAGTGAGLELAMARPRRSAILAYALRMGGPKARSGFGAVESGCLSRCSISSAD